MEIYRSGQYSLDFPKELQGEWSSIRQQFTPEDPKIGIIQDWLDNCKYDSVCSLMIYDRHPELQSKWDKAFWARGYYVETIGNITDEAVQKYIKEQAEESRKEDSRSTAL